MAPPHSWSRSPTSLTEEESQELGTAQHSLATLADGVLQILGCSSSPLKCSSGKMQNLQVSRENLSLFCSTRNLCGRTPLCKTPSLVSLPYLLFPVFLHMTALLNPITFLSLHVQLVNQVFLDLPFVLCRQIFWV